MNRRKLLTMIPAASALLAIRSNAAPVPAVALNKAGFTVSVQCWSFNKFTLFEALEKASIAGASAVELYPGQKIGGPLGDAKLTPELPDEQLKVVIAELEKRKLTAVNFGVTQIDKDEAKARALFEFGKKLGLYGITTESLGAIDTIEKMVKEYGIKVCFHNHPKPTALWDPETIWKVIEKRDENIGFCADVGHWATSGMDPLEVVKKFATRIHSFHLKDRQAIGKATHDDIFGTGVIDIPGILDTVLKAGFKGNVSMEYEYNWMNNVPDIAQNIGFLRAYANLRKA